MGYLSPDVAAEGIDMNRERPFLGFPCPPEISSLFGADNAPNRVSIMVSSLGFLRADIDSIFISDHDLPPSGYRHFLDTFVKRFEDYRRIALRVYKTKQGFRTIGARSVLSPCRNSRMLYESDCDERYTLMSIEANRYSCRLTPKLLRLGLHWSMPQYLKFRKNGMDAEMSMLFEKYAQTSRDVAVCSFVSGPLSDEPSIAEFIDFHDKLTKAHESLPLA